MPLRDLSPDYEPLSPAMSSPGPSISERGGKNSPARSLVSEPGHAYASPIIAPTIAAAAVVAAPVTMTIATPEPAAPIVQPRINVSVQPQQQQTTPPHQQQQKPSAPRATPIATAAGKPRTIVFASPQIATSTNAGPANAATVAAKPRYVIEKTAGGSTIIVSDGANTTNTTAAVAVKRPAPVQAPQSIKKEVKIFKMEPAPASTPTAGATAAQQPQQQQLPKKLTIQMRDGGTKTVSTTAGTTYVINKTSAGQFAGVRKLVRVQSAAGVGSGVANAARSILLPVSFQDVKDFRTIKIINASNLNNKSANIKLAAANMLQQSKQGLVQKNVLFSKEQLIGELPDCVCLDHLLIHLYLFSLNRRFPVRPVHLGRRELRLRGRPDAGAVFGLVQQGLVRRFGDGPLQTADRVPHPAHQQRHHQSWSDRKADHRRRSGCAAAIERQSAAPRTSSQRCGRR